MHDVDLHQHHQHAPPVGAGVVLDIGGDIGAAVVYLGGQPVGPEMDIQPVGDPAGRFHTGVHDRDVDGTVTRVAVYPEVPEGRYELLDAAGRPFATLAATGGSVVTLDLR